MSRRMHWMALAGWLAAMAAQPAHAGVPEPLVSLPLAKEARGSLSVMSHSKDGVPLRVVFDSAATNSILFDHPGTAKVARQPGDSYMVYFPFTDRLLDFREIGLFTLTFGRHSFSSNSWVTGPWRDTGLFPGREEPHYDVIAGRDLLNNFALAVDPERGQAQLFIAGQDLTGRYDAVVPITDLVPLVAVTIRFTREDTAVAEDKLMLIDTGYRGVLLFADEEELTALRADEETPTAETLRTPLFADTQMQIADLPPVEAKARIVSRGMFRGADGIVGTSFLNKHRYAFDLTLKKLYLAARD